jgi:branched-chain amino acid transport system substrate-binding protein
MRIALAGVILSSMLAAFSGCASKSSSEPILIGHFAASSGPDRMFGEHARQAILLAVEEANGSESLFPGRRVAVLHPDYPFDDPDAIQNIAVRLILADRVVGLLGGTSPAEAKRLARAAKDYDVPVITSAELTPDLTEENLFSVDASVEFRAQVLARFAVSDLKSQHVVLLSDTAMPAGSHVREAFQRELGAKGGRHTEHWTYKSENELGETTERIKKAQASAVLFFGTAHSFVKLGAKLRAAGISAPLIFGSDGNQLSIPSNERERIDNVYWATSYIPEVSEPRNQEFVKKYKERFHEDPDASAALAYDGLHVLLEAMHRANSTTQDAKILKELASDQSKPFDCLTGSFAFDKNRSLRRPLFVMHLNNGQISMVKRDAGSN